jgi:hypothetical protein
LSAQALGDVEVQYVWRLLRTLEIDQCGARVGASATIRNLRQKQPVSIWRTPRIPSFSVSMRSPRSIRRARGYLKLPNGRTLTGHSHDYKRNGTTTLLAASEVASSKVKGLHKKRRHRKEFLAFMNAVVADYPGREIEVILDKSQHP